MNFTPHQLFLSKVFNRLTFWGTNAYRALPVKQVISLKTRCLKDYDAKKVNASLRKMLGDFGGFSEFCKDPDRREAILNVADRALEREFDLLGSGPVKLNPIDWHCDFKSGYKWTPGKFYRNYGTVDYSSNSDVKVPWELSRCHHHLWLGQAYLLSEDEKYAEEIVSQIDNWINENPLMYSINWTCAMDVAIRATNWLYAVNMITNSSSISDTFAKKLTKSLYEHAYFIFRNLEKGFPYSKNHYASDITGLLFVAHFLIDTKEGKKWWDFALREFFSEVRQQILPSGVHFERTTSYHRLMTELFFYSYLLLKRVGVDIPSDVRHRVRSMFDFIQYYTRPDGTSPNFGDNDDGRLLPFIRYDYDDHRYLVYLASEEFSTSASEKHLDSLCVDSFFLINNMGADSLNTTLGFADKMSSRLFSDAGFCIVRHDDFYMFITNSELSGLQDTTRKAYVTHTHADLLSFELAIGDATFLVDPGSYLYTSSITARNQFRGTSYHNTLTVDGFDQHELADKAFVVSRFASPISLQCSEDESSVVVEGAHDGYSRLDNPVMHTRVIHFDKESHNCVIKDQLDFNGSHEFALHFHFHPEIALVQTDGEIIAKSDRGHSLRMDFECDHELSVEVLECYISRSYGVKKRSSKLKITLSADVSFDIYTCIAILDN